MTKSSEQRPQGRPADARDDAGGDRIERMRTALQAALAPESLQIRDDSHLHVGHAGARSGAGHYHVTIRAAAFNGKPPLERHRLVYAALDDMMGSEIHALSISAQDV